MSHDSVNRVFRPRYDFKWIFSIWSGFFMAIGGFSIMLLDQKTVAGMWMPTGFFLLGALFLL